MLDQHPLTLAGIRPQADRSDAQAERRAGAPTRLCVVVPVFNEEEGVALLIQRLAAVLEGMRVDWSVLFVDDGSADGTLRALRELHRIDRRITAISFSRNFGKETAIAAGLRYADPNADVVVTMDADLQHPPETIPTLLQRWREGYSVVFAQRSDRDTDGPLRRLFSRTFYMLFATLGQTRLPQGIGDFLLFDRKVVAAMNRLGERTRFNKGLYAWVGFRSATVPFRVAERAAGTSKWSFRRLAKFAIDGIICFSSAPLKIWSYIGSAVSLVALSYAAYFIGETVLLGTDVPGFPSLFVSIMFFSGIQLISLGFMGEYLARVYEEVKGRPLFLVSEEIGLAAEAARPAEGRMEPTCVSSFAPMTTASPRA
ncbi:Glycosyltransferase involved in cell wall bisynthesis [Faunimonas pinastri]|uniref:Glycosyltransferase involved in cell wall bisynthesis n=1 Tax=Faunimonas pinastri TaxID=1855383 RepID=A0A1H9ID45_9HYPH|nr:glycosyltransferase family 2 protein [Faunimonas pinastri]SEQ72500.1 Glycosyltransferase involved in cell wall bisynthesis [Faunimonas pinastri]